MEEPIQIPEDLSGIADDDLANLSTEIQERIVSLAEEARESDDALAAWEALIVEHDRINEEIGVRTERAAERNNRVEAALSRFVKEEEDEAMADETSEDTETDDTVEASASEDDASEELAAEAELEAEADTAEAESEVDEVVEAEVEEDSAVEAAAEEAEDVTDAEPEVEAEVAEDAIVEAETEESDVVAEETEVPEVNFAEEEDEESDPEVEVDVEVEDESKTEDEEEEMTTDSEATASDSETPNDLQEVFVEETPRSDVSGLSEHRPEAVAPRESSNSGAVLTARGAFGGAVAEGQQIDIPALAKAIAERNVARNNVPSGTFEYVTLASAVADFGDNRMTGSAEENFSVLRRIAGEHANDRKQHSEALVASGGVCAPLDPNYDFFRLAEEQNPVEQALPVAQASRGGIRYIQPPDFRDASTGVRVTTEAEDAAGYVSQGGPTPDKPCVAVTCPPILECRVDAVSKCVTFGNLNYRVFPEQVEAFLEDLSVIFTETKEIFYLDAIDAASTAVTAAQTYGATRSVVNNVLRAAENYRRRHHMAADATLELLAPSWLTPFLKVDLVNDHAMGLGFLAADDSEVVAFFAKNNINVTLYYDSATGAGQAFNGAQAAGALNEWPSTVVTYLYAPGTFVRLDAGTLDLGVVRDSVLNGTNDLQIFAEQWVQVCQVGIESLRIEHTLCPDGTGPEPVAPLVCPVSG